MSPNQDHRPKTSAGEQCFSRLRGVVQRCIDEGRITSKDPDETAQVLWAGVHGVTSLLIMHSEFPFVEQSRLVERMVQTLIEGVRKK
jgi:hypothetical protein